MKWRTSRRPWGRAAGTPGATRVIDFRWFASLVALVVALTALSGSPATAQDDAPEDDESQIDGLELDIVAGVDGIFRPGRPVPIDIQIEANQLLIGEILLTSVVGQQTLVHRLEIEVPASSRKRFVVPMPTPASERPEITLTLNLDGAESEKHEVSLREQSNLELVGVLPLVTTATDLPESVDLVVDAGSARLFAISSELLGAGFDGLWIFDSLVATNADIDALSSREADAVLAWVGAGGHLLVDETGGTVPRIPAEWQPTPDHAAMAGRGLVRFTDGLAKAGSWDEFLLPTPIDGDEAAGDFDIRRFTGGVPGRLTDELSRDAGFQLPPIVDLLALFGVYALVAGPISYMILRRRGRPTALWVTIPVFSVLATIGVWFVGSELRSNTSAAHATVILTSEGIDFATSHVLVGQDAAGIQTPRGWTPTGRVGNSAYDGDRAALEVTATANGFTAEFDLDSGQFAIASARGPVEISGLAVTATSDRDGVIEGNVTNESSVTIDHVTVISGSEAADLGTFNAGETRPFTLNQVDRFDINQFEREVWGEFWWQDPTLTTGLWNASRTERGGVNSTPLGLVTVAGWTDQLPAPIQTRGGDTIESGHTLLIARTSIDATGDSVSNVTSASQLVRGPSDTGAQGGIELSGVYQFHAPENLSTEPLSIHIPRYVTDVDIWQGTRWRPVQVTRGESRDAAINLEDLTIDGLVFVRMELDPGQIFEFDNGGVLTISQEAA